MGASSPFLALPTELRLEIYSHLFSVQPDLEEQTKCPHVDEKASSLSCQSQNHPRGEVKITISDVITCSRHNGRTARSDQNLAAILRTCTQVYHEAVGVLYQQTLFRIALGARGIESVGADGELQVSEGMPIDQEGERRLTDFFLLGRMQHVQLDLNFGCQTNPLWDALAVTRALLVTLRAHPPKTQKGRRTTAKLRFGLMTAMTCARLPSEPWELFLSELASFDFGCVPDVEIDQDCEKWTKYVRQRFEDMAAVVGGEMDFVRFHEKIGPHDDGLKACVIL